MCVGPQELSRLTERLSVINEELQRKMAARNEFDQTIQETEAAYMKVCVRCCCCVWCVFGKSYVHTLLATD